MHSRAKAILSRVEHLRQKMYEIVDLYGIDSQQALIASQHVDDALNEYYRLQRKVEEIAS